MVKAASHHGLDRKYKPWRRGKSQNAKGKKGSLKQQLRGLRRLLAKKQGSHDGSDNSDDNFQELQQQIQELEAQIGEKQKVEQQKTNARKSHGVRFLERQRLTRLWQTAEKLTNRQEKEQEQRRIGLDMLYVAHYPLQVRYQPLFRKKERILLDGRNLARRATARGKILRQAPTLESVPWIPAQVYDTCPTEWSNEKERETFGVVKPSASTDPVRNDDRFSSAVATDKHAAILQAAQAMDAELDAQEGEEIEPIDSKVQANKADNGATARGKDMENDESSFSEGLVSDSEEEDSDHADPLAKSNLAGPTVHKQTNDEPPAAKDPSSEDDSSSDDSSSSSSSSSDEESDNDDDEKIDSTKQSTHTEESSKTINARQELAKAEGKNDDDDDDDFLVSADAAPDATDIFANAKEHVPSMDEARGDKSRGWATQRQRPGQFKKRRVRNY